MGKKKLTQEGEANSGRREPKREIIQERKQIPGGRSQRGPMMEKNEERQLRGVTSESMKGSDRSAVSVTENLLASESKKNSYKEQNSIRARGCAH